MTMKAKEPKVILLSIHPKYAEKIFSGTKQVELRKVKPKIEEGDMVFVYVSSPVKQLHGQFEVEKVIVKPLAKLWAQAGPKSGMSEKEFYEYFGDSEEGCGIYLRSPVSMRHPISLDKLRELLTNFHPPQNYKYLNEPELNIMMSAVLL